MATKKYFRSKKKPTKKVRNNKRTKKIKKNKKNKRTKKQNIDQQRTFYQRGGPNLRGQYGPVSTTLPTVWDRNSGLTKIVGTTAAVVVGAISLGFTAPVVLSTAAATFIISDTIASNPIGVTLTGITPVAQTLKYTGLYTDEDINKGVNDILHNVDPTFGENKYFDIGKRNGINRVGTTDPAPRNPDDLGFFESIFGMAHDVLGVRDNTITGYVNFVQERTPKQQQQQQQQPQQQQEPASAYTQEPMDIKGARSTITLANGNQIPTALAEGQTIPEFLQEAGLQDAFNTQAMDNPEVMRENLRKATIETFNNIRESIREMDNPEVMANLEEMARSETTMRKGRYTGLTGNKRTKAVFHRLIERLKISKQQAYKFNLGSVAREKAAKRLRKRTATRDADILRFNLRGEAIVEAINRNTAKAEANVAKFNQGAQARVRALGRVDERNAEAEANVAEFNERAQARVRALGRVDERREKEEAKVDEFNRAQARVRALGRLDERRKKEDAVTDKAQAKFDRLNAAAIEADIVTSMAQIAIEQGILDAMPEYVNEETPIDQQYDPRYGQAYADNLERTILNSLNVNKPQGRGFDPNNIGDFAAAQAIAAYITRGFIRRLLMKKPGLMKTPRRRLGQNRPGLEPNIPENEWRYTIPDLDPPEPVPLSYLETLGVLRNIPIPLHSPGIEWVSPEILTNLAGDPFPESDWVHMPGDDPSMVTTRTPLPIYPDPDDDDEIPSLSTVDTIGDDIIEKIQGLFPPNSALPYEVYNFFDLYQPQGRSPSASFKKFLFEENVLGDIISIMRTKDNVREKVVELLGIVCETYEDMKKTQTQEKDQRKAKQRAQQRAREGTGEGGISVYTDPPAPSVPVNLFGNQPAPQQDQDVSQGQPSYVLNSTGQRQF